MTTGSNISTPRSESACGHGVRIRVRGTVQGVGFRPMVWRIARELGVVGDVANDAEGVLIRVLNGCLRDAIRDPDSEGGAAACSH